MGEKCPTYSPAAYAAGCLNLVHSGAIVLAVLFLASGWWLAGRSTVASIILLSLAGLILCSQIISRLRHMRELDCLRNRRGKVEFWDDGVKRWVSEDRIERIVRKNFSYSDPWRPVTLGYPGIEVFLSGVPEPVEVLYPAGLEELRDSVFEYLSGRHPGKASSEVEDEEDD
jgi:hypothetical protein